jgi:hypothetical protein
VRRLDEHTMESTGERHDPVSPTERQPAVKLTAVAAAGLAASVAAFFTSRFGITGTILGTALTAMIITVGSAVLGVYLERAAAKARSSVPGVVRVRSPRRRSVLLGGLLAALLAAIASFVIGIGVVTSVELSVGKSLTCWVWHECPTKDDGGRGAASRGTTGTHPSILGGGQRTAAPVPKLGGVEQPQQAATHHEQEVAGSPHATQGRLGGAVRAEHREALQKNLAVAPAQDAKPHQASGSRQPAQERPGATPPDGQTPKEQPGAVLHDSDQPVSSDGPAANQPPSEQPVRPSPSVFQ